MIRRSAAVFLMTTTLGASAAVAQTTPAPTPSTAAPAPMVTAPASATPAMTSTDATKFVVEQGKDQFRASKFIGLDIYGAEGQKIGDIAEVLIEGTGNAKAIVIGVGGFLGIGQKNVAVSWSAVDWKLDRPMTTASTAPATPPATTTTGMGGSMTGGPATTASTAPVRSPAEQAAYNGYPDHGMVKMTKAELQDAPAFKYVSDTASTAPRQ